MVRNAKQIWLWFTKWFSLIRYCMIHECTIIKCQTETIHIVFYNETKSKTINRLRLTINGDKHSQ